MHARTFATARRTGAAVALAMLAQCAPPSRFALRAPLLRDDDARPIVRAPAARDPEPVTTAVDMLALRPLSHALLFDHPGEARNVNALDEVPDSTWFTNRTLDVDEAAVGPCAGDAPATPPFTVLSAKTNGTTPGVIVRDATGRRFAVKVDPYARELPETNTAADAIVTRLYWAAGFNSPCNAIAYVAPRDFALAPRAYYLDAHGHRSPLARERIDEMLERGVRAPDGRTRVSTSLFVEGEPLGPWSVEGVRADDPNDVIPHEDRRELRGERFLAAWVNHWDSREQNSFDTFVRAPGGRGGYVRHWFIDFSDSLGSHSSDPDIARRLGYETYADVGTGLVDLVGFGLVRRPWDDARIDPSAPTLGYFGDANFAPAAWTPVTPLPRFMAAQDEDLAWMARRIARITPEHVRAIVAQGRYSRPAVAARVAAVLIGRRERILRWSFARTSPLADLAVARDGSTLCATDLGLATGLDAPDRTAYAVDVHTGRAFRRDPRPTELTRGARPAQLCAQLAHFAPDGGSVRADDAARYAVLDILRVAGATRTRLRAHLYDEGPRLGFVLVGVER